MDRRRFVGSAVACMLSSQARPQSRTAPKRVGYLAPRVMPSGPASDDVFLAQFLPAMRELGYVENRDFVIEARYAGSASDRLAQYAAELARMPLDVLVTGGPGGLRAAAAATSTIPIVMVAGSNDPIAEGYTKDISRPTRNITGLAYAVSPQRFQKELEYLKRAAPAITRVAIVWDLDDLTVFEQSIQPPLESAARNLGLTLLPVVRIANAARVDAAFAEMRAQRADALIILNAGAGASYRGPIVERALAERLPTVAAFRLWPEAGALMSYGPDILGIYRRSAHFVVRILKGAKPVELPIELPRSDELIINLRTARALGLTIPQPLLLRADTVIR